MEVKTRTLVRPMGVVVYSATPFFFFQNLFLFSYFCYYLLIEIRRRANFRSEGGPRRRNFVSLRGKQKFLLFACSVASRRLCYGAPVRAFSLARACPPKPRRRREARRQFRSKKVRISSNKRIQKSRWVIHTNHKIGLKIML